MEFKGLQNSQMDTTPEPMEASENKTGRFISLSVMLHATLAATVALMNVPPIEFPKKEIVEFEVESQTTAAQPIADGTKVPESKGAAPVRPAPPAPLVPPALPAKSAVAKAAPVVAAPKAAAPVPKAIAAKPATIDDINTPDLETSETGEVAVAQMDEKDLQEGFDKVDQENHQAIVAAQKSITQDADRAAEDSDEALNEVEKENQAKAKAAVEAAQARRKADLAALNAVKAREKAAASTGAGTGDEGEGTGRSGSPAPTKEVAGIPGGVRSLEQLRQIPGNKFPQYSQEERLARQEGRAVFYAYVNKDGSLSQFKLGRSTGYRNLDGKTLAALKKWKFFPGQEGWVEMPFKWALNGEALQAGGQLRK